LAIPCRLRVVGPCSMALMLCPPGVCACVCVCVGLCVCVYLMLRPPVPAACARIVVNAAKGA